MAAKVSTVKPSKKSPRGFLSGYFHNLQPKEARERYVKKLGFVDGHDPYEIPRQEWLDNLESWQLLLRKLKWVYMI